MGAVVADLQTERSLRFGWGHSVPPSLWFAALVGARAIQDRGHLAHGDHYDAAEVSGEAMKPREKWKTERERSPG